jgi:hypothetical protein
MKVNPYHTSVLHYTAEERNVYHNDNTCLPGRKADQARAPDSREEPASSVQGLRSALNRKVISHYGPHGSPSTICQ